MVSCTLSSYETSCINHTYILSRHSTEMDVLTCNQRDQLTHTLLHKYKLTVQTL